MTAAGLFATRLVKRFGDGTNVLNSAEITAASGRLTVIRGQAGSGRTTVARCLTGVYRPDDGEAYLRLADAGQVDLTTADPRTLAWLRAHHIAAFDGPLRAAPTLGARAAVTRAARCTSAAADAGLDRIGAAHVGERPLGRLRAERCIVALAAALLSERPVVVLDGPEDYAPGDVLADWLRELAAGGVAVVVTADENSPLVSIADAVGDLRRGEISWHTR